MKYIYIIVYGVSLQFDRHILYLLLHIFSLTIMFQSEWNIIQLMSLRNLHKYFICKTRSLHEVCMKLCIRKETDEGGRTEEMRRQKREKYRKKEYRVLWSEAACQGLPCRHCALMIPHTSETNSEDDDRFICCLWPHYCHNTLGQQLGSGEGARKKEKDRATEKSKKWKHLDLWSIIYFQSNAFTRLHLRNTGSLWSLFQ